jgi:NADH-quinone oxidoreductase subunit G
VARRRAARSRRPGCRRDGRAAAKAYLLLGLEPELDHGTPGAAAAALAGADTVIALSAYRSALLESADCLLPIAPFTETAGTFVNCAGTVQPFNGVVRPRGDARPGWKVLRVLGNLLGLRLRPGQRRAGARQALPGLTSPPGCPTRCRAPPCPPPPAPGLERVADVPIYFADPIVRRAPSLQLTATRAARAG